MAMTNKTMSVGAEVPTRSGALIDLLVVITVLVGVKQSLLPISVVYAGPASTFSAMVVATFLLFRRGSSWSDLGLRWPESWLKTFGLTAAIFGVFLVVAGGGSAIAGHFFPDIGASGRFDFVKGSLVGYLTVMALVWTHGSFFEELLFRAFIITNGEAALGGSRGASIAAVVLAAIFFGYRHYYYQGMHGAIVTGLIGLLFGLIYIWIGRRNILPLVFAHGIANSIAQTSRFLS
ncbi:CPBP family intramembrane glutamic endopeptidase [Parerythrobacter aestuarii]|uniref:CPBP family intramembrane glutamic endopeptidase n=1 Tax=Parerythrobacter aestuarii TaxID=3020909 RepID=UPI0024DE0353|nr:CPBP family intramembrane glutamic endopeptidase [Parerythrobacter aestuarii]